MKKYIGQLKQTPLFKDISETELTELLKCLNATPASYKKGGIIFLTGNAAERVGIVCKGTVQIIREDIFGNRTILANLSEGNLFGETFACLKIDALPVSVIAAAHCDVLLIDYRKIITTCPSSCEYHRKLIENMLGILAGKNLMLNKKIEALAARNTRDKLLTYLTSYAEKTNKSFDIPYNRQELADYLCVDRSAMSAELSRMRDEGLIKYNKNNFELL